MIQCAFLRSAWRSQQTFLFLFCFFFFLLSRSVDVRRKTFLFLLCFLLFLLRSADVRRKTFLFLLCFLLFFNLFFSTAGFLQRFLHYFSTDLDQIWQAHSPWWDKESEYNFNSIGPGVGTGRGPKVLLCFIIGKTLYTVRRDKNFT